MSARGPGLGTRVGHRLVGLTPYLFLVALELVYVEKQPDAFTRSEIGIMVAGGLCLAFASAGQVVVVMTGGIDLSIGGVISTATCLAATEYHSSTGSIILWSGLILLMGIGAGALNAICVTWLHLQPFIVTLASLGHSGLASPCGSCRSKGAPSRKTFSTGSVRIPRACPCPSGSS